MNAPPIHVVLHRPSSAENIGAVARVLMNLGLERLDLVAPPSWTGAPRGGGERTAREEVLLRARKTARRASVLLESARVHPDARAALAGVTWCCGTTSRSVEGRPRLTPRALAAELLARAASGPVAVLFGEERRGLSDRELELCQAVCTIPTDAAYDSMNLAQSVAVVAYELRVASLAGAGAGGAVPEGEDGGALEAGHGAEGEGGAARAARLRPRERLEPARHATLEALWTRLAALLAEVGYLNPQNPEHILADWRRLLARAEPTQREVELLVSAVRALERRLKPGGA